MKKSWFTEEQIFRPGFFLTRRLQELRGCAGIAVKDRPAVAQVRW